MDAEILTIGDELLIGQIVNTNAAWIGEELSLLGVDVARHVTLGDDEEAIQRELQAACESVSLVLITGGLGPTHDDLTKQAVAGFFGVGMRFDEATFENIQQRFATRGISMPARNRVQAEVPEQFEVLPNPYGTAPGLWYTGEAQGTLRHLAILPGVPDEMKNLMREEVLPRLAQQQGLRTIRHRTLLTTGIGESNLAERLGDLSDFLAEDLRLASLPSQSGTRLRLTAMGADAADVERRLDAFEAHLRQQAGPYIYGMNGETLEGAVGAMLRARGLTLATAESCTGGILASRLTDVSGSSAYMLGGIIAYANHAKLHLLVVDPATIEAEGAVSEGVAKQMAQGVRAQLGADIGIATTGIMGPTGGTPDKPIGTVWIGYADGEQVRAWRFYLAKDRIRNKQFASTIALNLIRRQLLKS